MFLYDFFGMASFAAVFGGGAVLLVNALRGASGVVPAGLLERSGWRWVYFAST